MKRFKTLRSSLGFALLLVSTVAAQADSSEPGWHSINLDGPLTKLISTTDLKNYPWIAYQVAMEANNGMPCCLVDRSMAQCDLNQRHTSWSSSKSYGDSSTLKILVQHTGADVTDLILAGDQCVIKGNDDAILNINAVTPEDSILFLQQIMEADPTHENIGRKALAAIALHQDSLAHEILQGYVTNIDEHRRHDAIFWLGEARNESGFQSLSQFIDQPNTTQQDRKKAVFALSVNTSDKALRKLRDLALQHGDDDIRSEAIFWLAEKDPHAALPVIEQLLARDDSVKVKKKAVFSLSQTPPTMAVPALINIIESSNERVIRKEALFWLGESGDQRALDYLEKMLVSTSG